MSVCENEKRKGVVSALSRVNNSPVHVKRDSP